MIVAVGITVGVGQGFAVFAYIKCLNHAIEKVIQMQHQLQR